jgi:hypothetical protein
MAATLMACSHQKSWQANRFDLDQVVGTNQKSWQANRFDLDQVVGTNSLFISSIIR